MSEGQPVRPIVYVPASCTGHPILEDGFIDTNGTTLYYKTMGSGEPIVVLHGGPGFDHQQFLPALVHDSESEADSPLPRVAITACGRYRASPDQSSCSGSCRRD